MSVACGLPLVVAVLLLLVPAWPASGKWLVPLGLGIFTLGHWLGLARHRQRSGPALPANLTLVARRPAAALIWPRRYGVPALGGIAGTTALLGVYFAVVTLVSGWPQATSQFTQFWFFIVSLALGFGLQVGLYLYLRQQHRQRGTSAGAVAVSGTTSTVAMVSCCAHYLANVLPLIATAGIASFVSQYQIQFFWVGLLFNLGGIIYLGSLILKHGRSVLTP